MGKLVQHAKIKTNTQKGSVCNVKVQAIKFADLWSHYPKDPPYIDPKTGKPPVGYENQCAMRASTAIHGAGVEMKSFTGASVTVNGKKLSMRAAELAAWLKLQPFCGLPQKPEVITGKNWAKTIKGKTGIIYFRDYWLRPGEKVPTGDHIDLWNESTLTPSFASFLRFTVGFGAERLWGLKDFSKSKEILFWNIK